MASGEYPPSKLWTRKGLADHMDVSVSTVDRLVKEKLLRVKMVRNSPRITHESYLEYLKSLKTHEAA